jgi:hypothetical protein
MEGEAEEEERTKKKKKRRRRRKTGEQGTEGLHAAASLDCSL